jgi:hypothetical protein
MSDPTLRVYVDSHPVDVPHSAVVIDAIEAADSDLASSVRRGKNRVTDSRGLPIGVDAPLHGGAILRVVPARSSDE